MKKTISNIFYSCAAQLMTVIVPLVTSPYISRVLRPHNLGIYGYIASVSEILSVVGSIGLTNYGIREIAYVKDNKEKRTKIFYEILILRTILFFVVGCVYALFMNSVNYCTKCQWKDGKICTNGSPKYFKNYVSINPPTCLFLTFEDNLNEEFINLENTKVSVTEHDMLMFQKIKNNLSHIEYILTNEFEIYGSKYEIRGIITQPYAGHYNAIIINVQKPSFLIDKCKNYYYDDTKNNNEIIEIDNWKNWIKNNIPILAIYEKIN